MKLTRKIFLGFGMLLITMSVIISACQKQTANTAPTSTTGARQVSLYLTDDPCNYDSVFIDIRYVEVKVDTSTQTMNDDHHGDDDRDGDDDHQHHDQYGIWDTLAVNPGVYNIIRLRNGVDTLLASSGIPAGKIRKIRLTLGTNNSVVVAGVSHPLSLFPGTNNYVYVKIHDEDEDHHSSTQTAIWIDFNVCESIKMIGGQYYLKPVLKPFGKDHFGEIEGKVFPAAAHATVFARNAADSATAIPENDGEYEIHGLRQGAYSITFRGSAGYRDSTITNVQVRNGQKTHIANITLHQ